MNQSCKSREHLSWNPVKLMDDSQSKCRPTYWERCYYESIWEKCFTWNWHKQLVRSKAGLIIKISPPQNYEIMIFNSGP